MIRIVLFVKHTCCQAQSLTPKFITIHSKFCNNVNFVSKQPYNILVLSMQQMPSYPEDCVHIQQAMIFNTNRPNCWNMCKIEVNAKLYNWLVTKCRAKIVSSWKNQCFPMNLCNTIYKLYIYYQPVNNIPSITKIGHYLYANEYFFLYVDHPYHLM